jgi:hypothetical protein
MHTSEIGLLGEVALLKYLTQNRWECYTSISGKSSFDVIAYHIKYGLQTFQVKTISLKTIDQANVYLKAVRTNKTTNKILKFDNTAQTVLCVYIEKTDTLLFELSKNIKATCSLSILKLKDSLEITLEDTVQGTKQT